MKAISLLQPWATLIAIGAKTIETRSWGTAYRGPIAIHASAKFSKRDAELLARWPFDQYPIELIPTGHIVATAELVSISKTEEWRGRFRVAKGEFPPFEEYFGDYSDGRFGWQLRNVQALRSPIPAKGMLGLWNWEPPQ